MEWPEVLERIESGEDRNTEFKQKFGSDLSGIGRALCAFANSDGGLIVLGVDDSRNIVGIPDDPHRVHERLTDMLQTGCSQPVAGRCGRTETADGWVHWIEAPRIRGYAPLRYKGAYYIRRERSSAQPSDYELQELFNAFGFVFTEEQTIHSATVRDVDDDAFASFMMAQGLDVTADFPGMLAGDYLNAGVVAEAEGARYPTLYGLLVFGRAPQKHRQLRNFAIRCSIYDGGDRAAATVSSLDCGGRLDDQVLSAVDWIDNLGRTEIFRGLYREDRALLPKKALREALVNAVVHRDYAIIGSPTMLEAFADRVTVTSPGALPNHMSVDSVRRGGRPRSRNESMAHAMVVARLMESRGRGWQTMYNEMRAFNGTAPVIENDVRDRFVSVTFRTKPEADTDDE